MNANANPNWVDLKEAAAILQTTPAALRSRLNNGRHTYTTRRRPGPRQHEIWEILRDSLVAPPSNYDTLEATWIQSMGLLRETTRKNRKAGMEAFWHYLDPVNYPKAPAGKKKPPPLKPKDHQLVNLEILKTVMLNTPGEATRWGILDAVRSFYAYLAETKKGSEDELIKLRAYRLPKKKKPYRSFVTDQEFQTLINYNQANMNGRSSYDILLTRVLLYAYRYTGARRNEIIDLKLKDLDMKKGIIIFRDTKTHEDRRVGIAPELLRELKPYLSKRPKGQYAFVTRDGNKLKDRRVNRRIKWLSDKTKIPIAPHGLRRSMITLGLAKGKPVTLMQKVVGHKSLAVTQQYDMTTDRDAIKMMQEG